MAVENAPYFYTDISRENAEMILWDRGCMNGMYLLRSSQNKDAKFVLSLCSDKSVYHYRIKETTDNLFYVHGVVSEKYSSLPVLVEQISGLICKPAIACNKPLQKFMPNRYYQLSSLDIQQAIEKKAREWGLEGNTLQVVLSDKNNELHSLVMKTLHEVQPWFHGKISRAAAEERLASNGHKDGKFLVRERDNCSYTLCISHEGQAKHYKIEVTSTGEMRIQDGPRFQNLVELVSHYSILSDGLWCCLGDTCPNPETIVVHQHAPVIHQLPATTNASKPLTTTTDNLSEANKKIKKLKPSLIKVLPTLDLSKSTKFSQMSPDKGLSPQTPSTPSFPSPCSLQSPITPLTPASPAMFKLPSGASSPNHSQPNSPKPDCGDVNNNKGSKGIFSIFSKSSKDHSSVSADNKSSKSKKAPVPLPRKNLGSKNKENAVATERRGSNELSKDNAIAVASPKISAGSGIPNMSSVIKQLQQRLSLTGSTENLLGIDDQDDSADEVKTTKEVEEPVYQEIDPDYDAGRENASFGFPKANLENGFSKSEKEVDISSSSGVSNNRLISSATSHLHGIRMPSLSQTKRDNASCSVASIPSSEFASPHYFSGWRTNSPLHSLPAFPLPPKKSSSFPSLHANSASLRKIAITNQAVHVVSHLNSRSLEAVQVATTDAASGQAQSNGDESKQVTVNGLGSELKAKKNLTGLCRKPTWTREESEKNFRSIKRFRKNPMSIQGKNIVLQEKLGIGNFGEVYKACFKSDNVEVPFAVKMLKSSVPSAKTEILREARIMTGLDHVNIVRLIGISEADSIMLVMELAPLGPLNEYLKNHSSITSIADVKQLLLQVASGMEYLEALPFVHRDLAARNVLLVNENFAKISDFGMSRALGLNQDYYQMETLGGKLPLKWYAPECIQYFKFSTKTDVWSYGVTLWEAMSFGEKPYMGMAGPDMWKMLMSGNRLEPPPNCPRCIYDVMLLCWKYNPEERPTFKQIYELLQNCDT